MEKKRLTPARIIYIITAFFAVVSTLILLFIWTNAIKNQSREEELRTALQSVIDKNGEAGLLAMVGIPVDNVFYGDQGLSLFQGERGSWTFSADEQQNIAVFEAVKESVVEIVSLSNFEDSSNGSGFIISTDGYVITNGHVVGSANTITVNLYNGDTVQASLVGKDSITDIAVIKLEREDKSIKYKPISFGSTSDLVIGQKAIAIGSPFGFGWSMSVGVISGLNRLVIPTSGNPIPNMIQTDASINPGNSGGPLIDGHGEVIGLVTAISSTTGTSQGISFAIPSDVVMSVTTELIRNGKVQRGWLDLLSVELNPIIVNYLDLPLDEGIMISQTVPSGEADKAGLRGGSERAQYGNSSIIYLRGDIITEINGKPIRNYIDYHTVLFDTKPGDKVKVKVWRNGSYIELNDVVLVEKTVENSGWILK